MAVVSLSVVVRWGVLCTILFDWTVKKLYKLSLEVLYKNTMAMQVQNYSMHDYMLKVFNKKKIKSAGYILIRLFGYFQIRCEYFYECSRYI